MDHGTQCSLFAKTLGVKAFVLLARTLLRLYSASSEPHPLFSASAAVGVVAILYLPRNLFPIVFSPVLLSTLVLLTALLYIGSPPPMETSPRSLPKPCSDDAETLLVYSRSKSPVLRESFLEWGNWGGPLEVIYEEYEGEEEVEAEEDGGCFPECSKRQTRGYDLFSHSGSDTGSEEESSSLAVGGESPESLGFRWCDEGDDLIEIALEEDNMFEIDISVCG